jgi:hypothetical protein
VAGAAGSNGSMSLVFVACLLGAGMVAYFDVITVQEVWRSQIFERPQKIAQTMLVCAIPGSFLLVRAVLHEGRRRSKSSDSTAKWHGGGDWGATPDIGGGDHSAHSAAGDHGGGGFDGGGHF